MHPAHALESACGLRAPAFWLLASMALAILATNISWHLTGRRMTTAHRLAPAGAWGALVWLAASLFFLLPPIAAWASGALSPVLLGWSELDWASALAAGAPAATAAALLFIAGWFIHLRSASAAIADADGRRRMMAAVQVALDVILIQLHWAFYRAAAIGVLAATSTDGLSAPFWLLVVPGADAGVLYWGSWLGMGLTAIESALNPYVRHRLDAPCAGAQAMRRVLLAVATTAVFILSRSFWIAAACHLVVEEAVALWPRASAAGGSAATATE